MRRGWRSPMLALALTALVPACASSDSRPLRPDETRAATCEATAVVREHMLDGVSFAEVVELRRDDTLFEGISAAVALSRANPETRPGPYGPVIEYLAAQAKTRAGQPTEVPLDEEVRRSARRLDRDLAAGMCPG